MEEQKKLYPFKFLPIGETFAWGGDVLARKYRKSFVVSDDQGNEKKLDKGVKVAESHEIADLGYRDSQIKEGWLAANTLSEVMDMYMDRVVGENVFEYYGRQFPVSVKFIDAEGRIPLMVHPDDEIASQRYDFLGKSKLWYVVDARPGSRVYMGFNRDADASDFYAGCLDGNVEGLLNVIEPRKGDFWLIKPGTVHAASDGVLLLEVSEASPLDFCLSGWGEDIPEDEFDPSLNAVEALDFINFKKYEPEEPVAGKLAKTRQFTVTRIDLNDPLRINSGESGSFTIYTCISGEASIRLKAGDDAEKWSLSAGETVLMPAEIEEFFVVPMMRGTVLVETIIEPVPEEDGYIDPDVEPQLPEEGEEFKFNSVYGRFSKN